MTASRTISLAVGVMIALGGTALAQPAPPPPPPSPSSGGMEASGSAPRMKTVGVDATFILPVGDYADGVSFAVGVLGRIEIPVAPQVVITGRLGYIYNSLENGNGIDLSFIPIYVGVRYDLDPTGNGVFLLGEVGNNHIRVSFMGQSDSQDDIGAILGGGFQTGKLSARGGLFVQTVDGADNFYGLIASVGYDFAAF